MDEAGALAEGPEISREESSPQLPTTVRVYENGHCHVDRESDGTFVVYHDTRHLTVGTFPADRGPNAVALANRVAGPAHRPKP